MNNDAKDFTFSSFFCYLCINQKQNLMIDQPTIDRIMDAAQIVEVVSEFVTLKKRGVNYIGLCPFHDDKTPSFYVSPVKGLCKCFACGKGGNVVHFLMEHEQMSYPEAMKWLAKKYHIEVREQEQTSEQRQAQNARESLFIVNEFAREYFHSALTNHPEGIAIGKSYFRSRGISDEIVRKFQLGFCPSSGTDLATEASRKGYRKEYLVKTGLCYEKDDRSIRDRFHGRVIFPWLNISGKTVGFGGRVLDIRTKGVAQKYVNSPESDIYSKRRELYGLYQAKHAIAKFDRVYMVEGYTDVIAMHQAGLENVVANSGTALSETQIRTLHRLTSNITLLYDGDEAGIKASIRGIDLLLAEGMNVKVLLLPDGDDPDSFARKHTYEELRQYIDTNEQNFICFKTNLLLKETEGDPVKRAQLISDIAHSIGLVPNEILRYAYLKECAALLDTNEQIVLNEVKKVVMERRDKHLLEKSQERLENSYQSLENRTQSLVNPYQSLENRTKPLENRTKSLENHYQSLVNPSPNPFHQKETELMRMLVRHGEKTVCMVQGEEGQDVPVSVAEYIYYDLNQDELRLQTPLYERMLNEVLPHIGNGEFTAERFFINHTDPEISRLAAELVSDRFTLSRSNERDITNECDRLHELIPHLMLEYKLSILKEEMKEVMNQLSQPDIAKDMNRSMEIMKRYKELTEIIKDVSKMVGDRVVS